MYIITALVALFQMRGSELAGNSWTDAFLDKMVGVESFFYNFAWWVWAIAIIVAIILIAANKIYDFGIEGGWGCGCLAIVLVLWPLMELLSVFLITGVADNFSAAAGVTNVAPFIIYLLLYLSIGAG